MVVPRVDRFSVVHHGKTRGRLHAFSIRQNDERRGRTTKEHRRGRVSRFLIKRQVPLGYHGHILSVLFVSPVTRPILRLGFLNYSGVIAERSAIQYPRSFLCGRSGYYGRHRAEKSRGHAGYNWREMTGNERYMRYVFGCYAVASFRFCFIFFLWHSRPTWALYATFESIFY